MSSSSSSRPRVTITLGRSGQVVKRSGPVPNVSHADYGPSSGSKRPVRERLGNSLRDPNSYSSLLKDKRQRTDDGNWSLSNDDLEDNKQFIPGLWVGRDDLRHKLLHKSISKRVNTVPDQRNGDLREKLSRNCHRPSRFDAQCHMPESRASGLPRQIPSTRSAEDLYHLDSLRKSYSFASNRPSNRSPGRFFGVSRGMSPPRLYDDLRHVPSMRSADDSRPANFVTKTAGDASRSKPLTSKAAFPVETAKLPMRAPPPSGGLQKSPYMSEEPLTVASLLHSLGLGKYAILFQAEEVDMAVLKQMGDNDLKELGIPMGPRKKILLAVLPRSKQRQL